MKVRYMASALAASTAIGATVTGGAGVGNASLSGSAGSGSSGTSRVSLTYEELAYGYARGTLSTAGDLADCIVGVTASRETAEAISDGGDIRSLYPLTTKNKESGIYGVGGGGADVWRIRELRIDHETDVYAALQCEINGETVSAMATLRGGPGGMLSTSSLGS